MVALVQETSADLAPQPVEKGKHRAANRLGTFFTLDSGSNSTKNRQLQQRGSHARHNASVETIGLFRTYSRRVEAIYNTLARTEVPDALAREVFSSPVTTRNK